MRVFFAKLGLEKIRFKPAYNPYTEVRRGSIDSYLLTHLSATSPHLKYLHGILC
jgi:phenylalanyl-tRNA synthetase alpha subunit